MSPGGGGTKVSSAYALDARPPNTPLSLLPINKTEKGCKDGAALRYGNASRAGCTDTYIDLLLWQYPAPTLDDLKRLERTY